MYIINIISYHQTNVLTDSTILEVEISELIVNLSLNHQFSAKLTQLKLYTNTSQIWFALIPGHRIWNSSRADSQSSAPVTYSEEWVVQRAW